jgi:pantetheine-phosphate adenylyltransferase
MEKPTTVARPARRFLIPGTYDPITRGHLDVIERATHLCDEVVVGVAASVDKRGGTAFSLDERVRLAREATAHLPQVEVLPFTGLLVDFVRSLGNVTAVVKGLRLMTDFEYELQQANINYYLAPELETIFVMGSADYGYVSSSVVREIASLGGDVSLFVTPSVEAALRERYAR